MFSKIKFDTVFTILLMGMGIAFWLDISSAPYRVIYYPRSLILIMCIPTTILLIRSLIPKYRAKLNDFCMPIHSRVLVTIGVTILYILFIPIAGYFVSTIAFIIVIMLFLGARNLLIISSIAIGMALFIYFMFSKLLLISLPRGFLF